MTIHRLNLYDKWRKIFEINKDDPFYEEYFDLHNIIFEVIKNLSRDNLDNEIKFIIEFTKKYDYDICSNNIMEIYERY